MVFRAGAVDAAGKDDAEIIAAGIARDAALPSDLDTVATVFLGSAVADGASDSNADPGLAVPLRFAIGDLS